MEVREVGCIDGNSKTSFSGISFGSAEMLFLQVYVIYNHLRFPVPKVKELHSGSGVD